MGNHGTFIEPCGCGRHGQARNISLNGAPTHFFQQRSDGILQSSKRFVVRDLNHGIGDNFTDRSARVAKVVGAAWHGTLQESPRLGRSQDRLRL